MRTTSGMHIRTDGKVCILAPGARVLDVADASRRAAQLFMVGALSWGRLELAQWLVGPYASAVASTRPLANGSGERRALGQAWPLDEFTVQHLLASSRDEVTVRLRALTTMPAAREQIAAGIVAGIVDSTSAIGYGPIDRRPMRLVDRVVSLFVADRLTRPADYATFTICTACEGPSFDVQSHAVECPMGHRSPADSAVRERGSKISVAV